MTDKAISPLRQRMIEDMTIRKLTPKTQHDYVQRVKNFAAFLGRSPDTASFEDVRRYQLHLATSGAGVPTLNQSVSTLRFFFRVTLGRADIVNHTQFVHEPRKPGAPPVRPAGGTARGRGYRSRRGQQVRADRATVSVLRRSHDHHRDIPARLLAAQPSRNFHARDQNRHIMIRLESMRHPRAAILLRRLSTDDDHARRRALLDNRRVVRSPLRDAASAPTGLVAPPITSRTSPQLTSAKHRKRPNPHSV